MPRPRLPNLYMERTRHGKVTFYVRISKGPRIRIREELDTPEFMAAYLSAMGKAHVAPRPTEGKSGSLAWLISRYRDSTAWASLATATRKQRENIFRQIIETAGEDPFAWITRQTIVAARDRRSAAPFAAKTFLKTMRGLFRWALEAGFVATDPTEGVKGSTPRTDGFHCWTEEEIESFEARWPIGTRERLALAILLYTGLRRGDDASRNSRPSRARRGYHRQPDRRPRFHCDAGRPAYDEGILWNVVLRGVQGRWSAWTRSRLT
jgi:hypothetical protein